MSGTPDESTLFGLAAVVTALATLVQTIRSTPPRAKRARRAKRAPAAPPAGPDPDPPTPPAPAAARVGIAWRGFLTLVFTGASMLTGPPAFAHHALLSGTTSCAPEGAQLVAWSIGNSQARQPMTIVSALAALDGAPWPVEGYTSPIAPAGATEATTTLSAALTGSLVLTVRGRWPDGHRSERSASVELAGDCSPTTSTSSPAPTTSTSSPATSSPSTTTAMSPATSTTIRPQPGTSITPPATSLPNTGGPILDAAIAGGAVLLLGLTFLMAWRVDRRYGATGRRARARRRAARRRERRAR